MTTVSAWIVDPQGRAVPGVDVELTAQGWRGQRWAGRSDARGQVSIVLPNAALRNAGQWIAYVPSSGVRAVIDPRTPSRLVVPVQQQRQIFHSAKGDVDSSDIQQFARSVDPTGRALAALQNALSHASPQAVAISRQWLRQHAALTKATTAGGF